MKERNFASVIFCGKPFASKQRLKSHVEVVHEGKNLKIRKLRALLVIRTLLQINVKCSHCEGDYDTLIGKALFCSSHKSAKNPSLYTV